MPTSGDHLKVLRQSVIRTGGEERRHARWEGSENARMDGSAEKWLQLQRMAQVAIV